MLVALPILMPADSPEQIVLGLIICFGKSSWGQPPFN